MQHVRIIYACALGLLGVLGETDAEREGIPEDQAAHPPRLTEAEVRDRLAAATTREEKEGIVLQVARGRVVSLRGDENLGLFDGGMSSDPPAQRDPRAGFLLRRVVVCGRGQVAPCPPGANW